MSESVYYKNRHKLRENFARLLGPLTGIEHADLAYAITPRADCTSTSLYLPEDIARVGRIFESPQIPKPWRTAMAHVAGVLVVRQEATRDELRNITKLPRHSADNATAMLTGRLSQEYALQDDPLQTIVIAPSEANSWCYRPSALLGELAIQAEDHAPALYDSITLYERLNGNS